ncbi:unnamed protein product, partial [Polarella glacialis]
ARSVPEGLDLRMMSAPRTLVLLGALVLLSGGAAAFTVVAPAGSVPSAATRELGFQRQQAAFLSVESASFSSGFVLAASATVGLAAALLRTKSKRADAGALLVARKADDSKDYWGGEWICADCGYIYNERATGQKFEDLQVGYKCPQCAAPRRRFARKLGDKVGTTLDGGDTPILLFSAGALVLVLAIAYFTLQP